jgi:hypothetical protein
MRTYGIQVTEVLAIHCSENEVAVFFAIGDKTEWSEPRGKFLEWNNTVWWIGSNNLIRTICAEYGSMWFTLHQIYNLPISIKYH